MVSFQQLCNELKNLSSALVSAHVSPDADAVGSAVGLAKTLSSLGVKTKVYLADPVPERMVSFLAGVEIISETPKEAFDAVVVVDTATKKRVGPQSEEICALGKKVIVIDHHISNPAWGDINYIDGTSASSAQIILQVSEALTGGCSEDVATLLMCGLMEDTGSFRFSNATADAFDAAKKLSQYGARPSQISQALYFSQPLRLLRLRVLALSNLESLADGKVKFVVVDNKLLSQAGAKVEDTDGLVDEARSVEGVKIAVLLREVSQGWKASLRTNDETISVDEIASVFGGGGHRAAAGCTLEGTIVQAKERLFSEILKKL